MRKNQKITSGVWKILIWLVLCGLVYVLKLVVRSVRDSSVPLRGLMIMMYNWIPAAGWERLNGWYEGSDFAPMLVQVLCALPVLGLGYSIFRLLFPKKADAPRKRQVRPVKTPEPRNEDPVRNEPQKAQNREPERTEVRDDLLTKRLRAAEAVLDELKVACKDAPFRPVAPLIRVQVLALKPDDYLLVWRNHTAAIAIDGEHEICLRIKNRMPHIVGYDESAQEEILYPLERETPVHIYRGETRRYVITWIGG